MTQLSLESSPTAIGCNVRMCNIFVRNMFGIGTIIPNHGGMSTVELIHIKFTNSTRPNSGYYRPQDMIIL